MLVYITKHNFHRIHRQIIDNKKLTSYLQKNLEDLFICKIFFFSDYESLQLLTYKKFLENPEHIIKEYYIPLDIKDTFTFIFENTGKYSAYHSTYECEHLNKTFYNIFIPSVIKEQGEHRIKEFRISAKFLFSLGYSKDDPEFIKQMNEKFPEQKEDLEEILRSNSGVENKENLNLSELEHKALSIIKASKAFYMNCKQDEQLILRRLQKHAEYYSRPNIAINNIEHIKLTTTEIKTLLLNFHINFKEKLKETLLEYYKVKYNPELKFDNKLLETLNFSPCKTCCAYLESEDFL